MVEFKSVEDILRFAIAKEDASSQFYMDMAEHMENSTSAAMFREVAKEELSHKSQLELELIKLGSVVESVEDLSERTAEDYMLETDLPKDMNYADILLLAMKKEQASYRLYMELLRFAENEEAIEVFMALAAEEVRHKLTFEAEYNKITQKKQ